MIRLTKQHAAFIAVLLSLIAEAAARNLIASGAANFAFLIALALRATQPKV